MSSPELPTSDFEHASELAGERSGSGELLPHDRELTWGERLSEDGFWVFDYLQGIGYTKNLRELAGMEGIDFDAGLEELRRNGMLDEGDMTIRK